MPDVSEIQQRLKKLIEASFDSFVEYKKAATTFDAAKKLLEKDLDIDEIKKEIEYFKEQHKKLDKVNMPLSNKASAFAKLREQQKKYAELLTHAQKNNSDRYLVGLEKNFLKSKEKFREKKIVLLEKINELKLKLNKMMGPANYKEYINQLYTNTLTDDTNTYTYSVKTIMKHLESGPVSKNAAEKSIKLNAIKSRKNVKNRKTQMEIEIEMIKLKKVVEKYGKYKELFIDKIWKIIHKEDDDMMKARLFKKVKLGNKEVVDIKPKEFEEFLSSTNLPSYYQKEVDKYNLILNELNEKNKYIREKLAKLKGNDLNALGKKNSIFY
jgi:hypothetical protein